MFRAPKWELDRVEDLSSLKTNKRTKVNLSKKQLELIEETNLLTAGEKMELILVSLGEKLTTEIYQKINYESDPKKNLDTPVNQDIESLEDLLVQLPFPFFLDRVDRKNRQTGRPYEKVWFQISLNEAVDYFMQEYAETITATDLGLLYGFPPSAVRAFLGLIETGKRDKDSPPLHFFAGVGSQEFSKQEETYYQHWWDKIKEISPEIIEQAEKRLNSITH